MRWYHVDSLLLTTVWLFLLLWVYIAVDGSLDWCIGKPARHDFVPSQNETASRFELKREGRPSAQIPPIRNRVPEAPPARTTIWNTFLTVATVIKNKRRWLREWIEFHRMIGVEHFIIYDSGSTDEPFDVVRYYVEEGAVEYIPWPPKEVPPPIKARTKMEKWRDSWYRDALETCLHNEWTIHDQGPCQLSAFADAIRRTSGLSRWLGIWDVDEYIFPRKKYSNLTLADVLGSFHEMTQIRIQGNIFGASGYVEPPQRTEGSQLQPLVTEEYTWRAELDRMTFQILSDIGPVQDLFPKLTADNVIFHGRGKLRHVQFSGADMYARKSIADPQAVSHSWVHHFEPFENTVYQFKKCDLFRRIGTKCIFLQTALS